MLHLRTLDSIVIIAYLAFVLIAGVYLANRVKGSDDFYVAGRSLGLFVVTATVCATIIGGGALVGRGGIVYSQGAAAVWLAVPYFAGMVFFSFFAGRIHKIGVKHNILSIPGLMERRCGRTAKLIVAVLIAYTMTATVGSQISATATILRIVAADWGMTYETGALAATAIFVCYTGASGLFGVVYTDVLQFLTLILSVYIVLPVIALAKVGGVEGLTTRIPPEMWSLRPDAAIAGYIFTNLIFTLAGAEIWQRAFAAKTSGIAFKGTLYGTLIYGATIVVTLVIGLCAVLLLPNLKEEYGTFDAAIPALAVRVLPTGLVGLAIAGLLAVLMSTSDSYLLIAAQTIVNDIMRTVKPGITEKQELLASRIAVPALGFGAMAVALYIRSAYEALMFAWTFYAAAVGIPAFAALCWKKATGSAVIAAMLAGFAVSFVWHFLGSPYSVAPSIAGSAACGATLYGVAMLTHRKGDETYLEP
jgi:SSS family solute:Na+ symporter